MMKKILKIIAFLFTSVIVLPGLIYLGLAIYYEDSFLYGTWINGIYCTGKTVEEVQQELTENYEYPGLTLCKGKQQEFLDMEELELSYDFKSVLEEYRSAQNPFVWYGRILTGHTDTRMLPKIGLDENKLLSKLYETEFYQENLTPEPDRIEMTMSEDGYRLQEIKEEIFNVVLAKEKIIETVSRAETQLDLEEEGCFFTRDETVEMQQIREQFAKIEELQQRSLTYQLKEIQKKVTPYEISRWILTDEQGNPMMDKEGNPVIEEQALKAFAEQLAKDYDSWKNVRFTTHDGREIVLTKGTYGTKIDQRAEVKFLKSWLKEPTVNVREPKYLQDNTYLDRNLIDHTYIEIDLTKQKMYYFENSKLVLETDVVTGCTKRGWGTPELACYIYNKTENAVLKGENYRSPVDYWMPVYGGIGIHDASWRDEFGGEIYIKDGSHGCINTPLEKVSRLYEMAEVGTPVVIHE